MDSNESTSKLEYTLEEDGALYAFWSLLASTSTKNTRSPAFGGNAKMLLFRVTRNAKNAPFQVRQNKMLPSRIARNQMGANYLSLRHKSMSHSLCSMNQPAGTSPRLRLRPSNP